MGRFRFGQEAVQRQILLAEPDRRQFFTGARHFAQGRGLGARHQNQPGLPGIGQRRDGGLIAAALLFQSGQRSEARRIAFPVFQKAGPGPRQLQQPDGVAGRRGIEHDVVVMFDQRRIGQQRRKFIERGDFRGAGPGELLFNALDHRIRQHAAHRTHDPVAVSPRRRLRVDLQRRQPRHGGNRRDLMTDRDIEDLADVRGWIGADQQRRAAPFGEKQGRRTGERGLAHPALAGEEQKSRRMIEKPPWAVWRAGGHPQHPVPGAVDESLTAGIGQQPPGAAGTTLIVGNTLAVREDAAVAATPAHVASSSRDG